MRHVIDAIAAQGRDKDTELLHVTRNELAGLDAFKRARTGAGLTKNPHTGIPEAGWFDQYVAPALPAVAGLAAGALTMNPVIGAGVGAAVGAGTKAAQGGTTQDALMGGVMGGISGYGAAGIGEGLATAGTEATKGALASTATNLANPATEIAASTAPIAPAAATETAGTATFNAPSAMDKIDPNLATKMGSDMTQSGLSFDQQAARFAEMNKAAEAMPQPGSFDNVGAGIKSITSDLGTTGKFALDQSKNALAAGLGTVGMMPPQTQQATTGTSVANSKLPKAEVYYTPYGERRTRIVAAEGGLMSLDGAYGDYDGAEDGQNEQRYALGGVASLQAQPRAGISNVGFKEGRYLQGPGDGVSDSIPARIDGHQEARLASGEFVIPARVVSELGNGSSDAGAQQLHGMISRVQQKRKSGKGIAYQANPRKLMPA